MPQGGSERREILFGADAFGVDQGLHWIPDDQAHRDGRHSGGYSFVRPASRPTGNFSAEIVETGTITLQRSTNLLPNNRIVGAAGPELQHQPETAGLRRHPLQLLAE